MNTLENYLSKVKLIHGQYDWSTKEVADYDFPNVPPKFFSYLKKITPPPKNLLKTYNEFRLMELLLGNKLNEGISPINTSSLRGKRSNYSRPDLIIFDDCMDIN